MVARSSGDSWRDAAGVGAQATALLERITPLVRADAEAWEDALAELHATTGGDLEKRNDALERKLDDAAAVPILIADTGADAASLAELAADRGEGAYRADAAVAAVLAAAGARAASHLVRVNLGVREGDVLFPVCMPDGVYLTPYDPDFEAVMESTRDYMRRHRNALRELARH